MINGRNATKNNATKKRTSILWYSFMFLLAFLFSIRVYSERDSHIQLENPISQPTWRLPVIANGTGKLSKDDLIGRVVYLDFWASWCGPCRLSLPALNNLFHEFNQENFSVIAVSVDYVEEDAIDFLSRYPVDYPVLLDKTGDSARDFLVAGMPSGYLIDQNGMIRAVHVGFRAGDEEILRSNITMLLKTPKAEAALNQAPNFKKGNLNNSG